MRDGDRFERALRNIGPAYDRLLEGDPATTLRRHVRSRLCEPPAVWRPASVVALAAVILGGLVWLIQFTH
ncbi:MAG: hypothetical protein M0Z66_14485 [Thermaerobacter sp.]|nr:hypothetical protein [Thermaerobacter sp.]